MTTLPQITLDLHRRYLERIIKQADYLDVDDDVILALTIALDNEEQYYHVEGKTIYRIKAWKQSLERRERVKIELEAFKKDVDKRKAAWDLLTSKVKEEFGFDDEATARQIAHGILVKNKVGAAMLLGVNLMEVPQISGSYRVIDGTYYYDLA